jgi:hypothetical protein
VVRTGEKRYPGRILVRNFEEQRLGGDGRMILNWILTETGREGLGLNYIMRERDKWRAVVNVAMNFRAIKWGKYLEQLRIS